MKFHKGASALLQRLSPVDYLNAIEADCKHTMDTVADALPIASDVFGGALSVGDMANPELLAFLRSSKNLAFTSNNCSFLVHNVEDPNSHEINCFMEYGVSSKDSSTGQIVDAAYRLSLVAVDSEGYVISSIWDPANASQLKDFFNRVGFDLGTCLRNMLESYDVSQLIIDAVEAIKTNANTALQSLSAKYGGYLDKLSGSCRMVYNGIISGLSIITAGPTAAVKYIINLYETYKTGKAYGAYGVKFNDTPFYVQGFFESVRVTSVITTLAQVAGIALAAIGGPIIRIIGLAASAIGAIASSFVNVMTNDDVTIDSDALNNLWAVPIIQETYTFYNDVASNDGPIIGIYDMVSRNGAITITMPSVLLICWRDQDRDGHEMLCVEGYLRFDFGINWVLENDQFDKSTLTPLNGYGKQESPESCLISCGFGDYNASVNPTNIIPTYPIKVTSLYAPIVPHSDDPTPIRQKNLLNFLRLYQGIERNAEHDNLLTASDFLDGVTSITSGMDYTEDAFYPKVCFLTNLFIAHTILLGNQIGPNYSKLLTEIGKATGFTNWPEYTNRIQDCISGWSWGENATVKLAKLIELQLLVDRLWRVSDTGVDPDIETHMQDVLDGIFSWKDIVNQIIPHTSASNATDQEGERSYSRLPGLFTIALYFVSDADDPAIDGFWSRVSYTSEVLKGSRSWVFTSIGLPDRDHPLVSPPKYTKRAFMNTILMSLGVAAVGVLVAVSTVKVVRAIQFRIQKKYQEVERLRYVYQDDPTTGNWNAYINALKSYNRFAFLTGQTRVSYLTGWDVEESGSNARFSALDKAVSEVSSTFDGSQIIDLIRGY